MRRRASIFWLMGIAIASTFVAIAIRVHFEAVAWVNVDDGGARIDSCEADQLG